MDSKFLSLNWKDVSKGLVVAAFVGALLPIAAAFQTPGFSIFTVDLGEVINLAINGALVGFTSYMVKNFLSTADGKFLGSVG